MADGMVLQTSSVRGETPINMADGLSFGIAGRHIIVAFIALLDGLGDAEAVWAVAEGGIAKAAHAATAEIRLLFITNPPSCCAFGQR
jgi:hypothetical protein